MNVLKLSVEFDGRYGYKREHVLMPIESNGVIFGFLQENEVLERRVDLGELEGKHSECYGDLIVETIDLSSLNPKELESLVKESSFGDFEIFFETVEYEFKEYIEELKDLEEEEFYQIESEEKAFYANLGIVKPKSSIKSRSIYDAFMLQIENFIKDKKTYQITILASDLEKAQALLLDNGIELF